MKTEETIVKNGDGSFRNDAGLVLDDIITLVESQLESDVEMGTHLTTRIRKRKNDNDVDDSIAKRTACDVLSPTNDVDGSKVVKCWSCKVNVAKYKCPRCSIRTCSVACVKHHKQLIDCNGIRYRTGFVSKDDFNENHLLGDYRFLEEINHKLRPSAQDENAISLIYNCSKGKKMQVSKARSMGIDLQLMPNHMSRKKKNTTFYVKSKNHFLWHVEWIFVTDGQVVTHHDKRVLDSTPLKTAVKKYISVKDGNQFDCRLSTYTDNPDVKLFLKKHPSPANKMLYYELDGDKGLNYNLKGKTIIEFPTVHVVLPSAFSRYPLFISVMNDDHDL